ncbi:MAG: hypothetical protein QXI42_00475 [Thermoproteota archaeon]
MGQKTPDIALPRLIPEIPLEDLIRPRKDLGMEGVIISISKIDSENMKRVESEGIHNFLGFDGPILLSTVMPDRLLTDETFNFTLDLAKNGGFDGVIGWDMPVYADYPRALNVSNLVKATSMTMKYIEEGIPTIPLLKGGDSSEIALHSECLKKLNFKRVGLHATEYVLAKNRLGAEAGEGFAKISEELYSLGLMKIYEIEAEPLIIGVLSPESISEYKSDPKASLAGMSWLIEARNWRAYAGTTSGVVAVNLGRYYMECNCDACSGKSPSQIAGSTDDIAWHNWAQLREYAEKGKLDEVPVYDMVLEKSDVMAVVGDLHIGTPQSLWLPCLRELKRIYPTHLVLLGDMFDFVKGEPKALQVVGFFRLLKGLGAHVRFVLGCSDSGITGFLETLGRFAFVEGPEEPQLFSPNPTLTEAMRDLVAFWRFSRRRVRVKLPDGRMAVLSHGDELGLRRGEDPEKVMEVLLKDRGPNEVLVIGHYHRSLYNLEEGGVMLGAWQAITSEKRKAGPPPDIGDVLIIRGDGSAELVKGM